MQRKTPTIASVRINYCREILLLFARRFANTWDEHGLHDDDEAIGLVLLENAQSRFEALQLGVTPLVFAQFDEARPQLQAPVAQGCYGLDLVNYRWHIKE
jgi:hypothetical protein